MNTITSAPILSLPDDVSCLFLALLAQIEPPQGIYSPRCVGNLSYRDESLGFLRLSEVCRRWRTLIISLPSLWSAIVFRIPAEPGKLALDRSKSAPIRAYIPSLLIPIPRRPRNATIWGRECLAALAIRHAARLSALTAHDLKLGHYKSIFCEARPLLQDIDLLYEDSPPSPASMGNICIDAPNLRSLRITFLLEDDDIGPFMAYGQKPGLKFKVPTLRSLLITFLEIEMTQANLSWIVSILRNCPLIEKLRLDFGSRSRSRVEWNAIFEELPVELTQLSSLELRGGPTTDIHGLLGWLGSPRPPRLILAHERPEDARDALGFAKTNAHILHNSLYDGLLVKLDSSFARCKLEIAAFPALASSSSYSSDFPDIAAEVVMLSIESTAPSDGPIHRQIVDILTSALKDNSVRQLVVDAPTFKAWPSALETILSICSATTDVFIQHPWNYQNPGFPLFPTPGVLPALDTLSIRPVLTYRTYRDSSYGPSIRAWWTELSAWLERRAYAGSRVHKLRIYGQNGDPGYDKVMSKHGSDEAKMRQHAAELVGELLDERYAPASSAITL